MLTSRLLKKSIGAATRPVEGIGRRVCGADCVRRIDRVNRAGWSIEGKRRADAAGRQVCSTGATQPCCQGEHGRRPRRGMSNRTAAAGVSRRIITRGIAPEH